MLELMFDLETEDTKHSAVVLSVGAVIWESVMEEHDDHPRLTYRIFDRFYRVLDIEEQIEKGRTQSHSTLSWWKEQDSVAYQEAYNPVRNPVTEVLNDFREFAQKYADPEAMDPGINAFWASPACFDFPIWEDLAMTCGNYVPWSYRQRYDVRTVVREARYSVEGHDYSHLHGVPHTPVYDCEAQIDLLTAARNKLAGRGI